jgi:outer membrane lipoprotein-sorting protein
MAFAVVVAFLALALLAPGQDTRAAAAGWNVETLMQDLARHRGGKVDFSERKYIAMLERPVESSGYLLYRPPARLERHTVKPAVESLVLDGDRLIVERGSRTYTLQLQQYPEIAAVVGSLRSTLAGDLDALRRHYRVDLQGDPQRWTLTLLPSDVRIAAIVQRIEIAGARNQLQQIEMQLTDGDRSVMQIRNATAQ